MRALLDLAGRERWLYSSWDKWAAYPSVMNCEEETLLTYIITHNLVLKVAEFDLNGVKCLIIFIQV